MAAIVSRATVRVSDRAPPPRRPRRKDGRPARALRGRSRSPVALTGTPGVGKTAVASSLARRWAVAEVAEIARRLGATRPAPGGVEVDVRRLRRALRSRAAWGGVEVVVGHLAHLLPVRRAIVLRCHPGELSRRLRRAHRGTAADRRANVVAEAIDLVLTEAVRRRLNVYEVDTTGRTVGSVVLEVDRRLRRTGPPRRGTVDWLADRSVTAHLLDRAG